MSMDGTTKRRLFLGFIVNWIGKVATSIIQLVQVPVFLHFWTTPLFGEWLILNSIPAYLSFSSIGFGNVAGNEMTMMVARNDRDDALRIFQSCWWLIVLICSTVLVVLVSALYFLPVARLLKLTNISEHDTKWTIFFLGLSVFFGQLEQLLQSAYRSIGRYPYGAALKTIISFTAFGSMIFAVALGSGPRTAALVFAAMNIAGTLILCLFSRRDIPWINFGWKHARLAEIRRLTPMAVAFMGFPAGNALNLQGTLLAVGYALGPVEVVIFGTARTVSRVALQVIQMMASTFEPEISIAYGAGNYDLVRTLVRRSCQFALMGAVVIVLVMVAFGPWFLTHWTGGHVPPSRTLVTILLLVVVVYSLWSTSAALMTSTNQHQRLATYYIIGTSLTCICCYFFARTWGLYGAAASLLISETVMNLYVVPAALRIAHDTLPAFVSSLFHYPTSLRPAALLAHLRRSRPGYEG